MAIKINKSTMVLVEWDSVQGRHHVNEEEAAVCLTCPNEPPYGAGCRQEDHRRKQEKHQTLVEDAPEEAKKLAALYREIHKRLKEGAFSPRQSVYLTTDDPKTIEAKLDEIRMHLKSVTADFKVCRADINFTVIEVDPGSSSKHTLASVQKKIEGSIAQLLQAVEAADLDAMKKAVKETKGLSLLLDAESKTKVDGLTSFTSRAVGWLKDVAEKSDDKIGKVQKDVKEGAARFANIFAGLAAEDELENRPAA